MNRAPAGCLHQFVVVYLYGRLGMHKAIERRSFRFYQEALLVGEVLLLSALVQGIMSGIVPGDKAAPEIGVASLWGAVRAVFLVRVG